MFEDTEDNINIGVRNVREHPFVDLAAYSFDTINGSFSLNREMDGFHAPIRSLPPLDQAFGLEIVEEPNHGRSIEAQRFREIFLAHWLRSARDPN